MKLKRTAIIILACVILMGSVLASSALSSHSYAPWFPALYMHLSTCKFSVDCASVQDHQVRFHITYDAEAEMFDYSRLTLGLQKRVLGLFWRDIPITVTERMTDENITLSNGLWISENQALHSSFSDTIFVEKDGRYRVLFTLETFGVDGMVDIVERSIEIDAVRVAAKESNPESEEQNTPPVAENLDRETEADEAQTSDPKEERSEESSQEMPQVQQEPIAQPPLEYGVLERGEGYVIYDSALFGEITLYSGEIALPMDGEALTYEQPIELFREDETGYSLPVTGVSRDGLRWCFTTELTQAPFIENSDFKLQILTADGEVTVGFYCNYDENLMPIPQEDGTITYVAVATEKNGEVAYSRAAEKFEQVLGHEIEQGKSYYRVYTVKDAPVPW